MLYNDDYYLFCCYAPVGHFSSHKSTYNAVASNIRWALWLDISTTQNENCHKLVAVYGPNAMSHIKV